MATGSTSSSPDAGDFSVMVLASDLGIDARPFLSEPEREEKWHDCSQFLSPDEDFSDLDFLQFFSLGGSDSRQSNPSRYREAFPWKVNNTKSCYL
ncbi:hypothetical protein MLD38_007602 [Melastoma candidum]|uniref:Uncharacterized protein n=1 Tax=Melastoma candidum TaxID=119954 RepID=A0ACB9RRB8_9MYRT|nr:hypothetical protein MLD38_007602 [Melastoma candidum]